jgi:hypothetical protein
MSVRWAVVLTLLTMSHLWAAEDGLRADRLRVATAYWERLLAARAGEPDRVPTYPTEPAVPMLSAYALTRREEFAAQAARQLAYAHAQERDGMLVVTSPGFPAGHRDAQARQVYNFYLAYRVLADGQYLRWADACAQATLRVLPRAAHECAGETHVQFAATFMDLDDPASTPPSYAVDVNQNAEAGLAFGLLYHDPASVFFRDPLAKEIALEEALAAMSVQDPETGAIPLTEGGRSREFDTAYGSYAAFSWVWSQLLWQDERLEGHVRAAGRWLAGRMDLATDSDRYYSFRNPSTAMPPWEAYYRLPLYWYCGVDAREYIGGLFARLPQEDIRDSMVAPWAYYDLMGMPREYYLEGLRAVTSAPPPG